MEVLGYCVLKLLIDRSIERLAVTHVTELVPREVKFGPNTYIIKIAERKHCPPKKEDVFLTEQLPYVASVARAAKDGHIECFRSKELMMEMHRQKGPQDGFFGIDLFRDVPIRYVETPIRRDLLISWRSDENIGTTRNEQLEFFKNITAPRFIQIRNAVGDAHLADAYHLWTAEVTSLDGFLTLDKRFWNVCNRQRAKINSPARAITPKEVCQELGLEPTDLEKLAAERNPFG
jgi:hypothetical protein